MVVAVGYEENMASTVEARIQRFKDERFTMSD
jgi:hypothetical protein